MRSFIIHAFLFGIIVIAMAGGYAWLYREYFPAPRLTRNISFNQQMQRVKQIVEGNVPHSPDGKVNLLAVGSSMSLNNLNSNAVLEYFGDSNYVNVGSWSTRINQTYKITASLVDMLKPHTLLLTSNMEDWMNTPDYYTVDTTMLRDYLTKWSPLEGYLRTFRPSYYLREMEFNKYRMTDPSFYDFLGFDPWGGASIDVPPERVEPERNVRTIPRPDQVDHSLYPYLKDMAAHLAERNVHMIFIQSPYRESDQTEQLRGIIEAHEARVKEIIEPYGHSYVSGTDRIWPNELYIDPSHFKERGAYMFTMYTLGKLSDNGRTHARDKVPDVRPRELVDSN